MTDQNTTDWNSFTRYLDDSLLPVERQKFERRLESDAELREQFQVARQIWQGAKSLPHLAPDLAAMTGALFAHTSRPIPQLRPSRRVSIMPALRRSFGAPSAYLIGFVVTFLIGSLIPRFWERNAISSNGSTTSREYTTQRAQRAEFELPDGSRVILGPESKLQYTGAEKHERGNRSIVLEGQAYFSVTHDPARPFQVHAKNTVAQVLGTSFTVRAYATDRNAKVAVAEGKVAVGGDNPATILLAGDIGTVDSMADVRVTHNAAVNDILGWTRGRLSFSDVALQNVAYELEREYNLHIRITDRLLASRPVTITLDGQSASDAMLSIATVLGARYTRQGQTITFSPQ